ncbi:MAG: DUF58 domain-containing protein [archaeon]|nr:DUF58 domain-containing protein [archaeon]MCR4323882.1 DUF58 domain-containing protein [Nanoarchaeota archaeon]
MARLKIGPEFALNRLDLAVKGLRDTAFLGEYKSVFKGGGLEFLGYRNYNSSSDDASRIDWKASKRVGKMVVKEFEEERDSDVIFVVDASSQMLIGSTKKLKAEYVAELVSVLSQSVLSAGDSFGLLLFSNKIIKNVLPERGKVQFFRLTDELSDVSNYGGYSDVDMALDYAFKNFRRGSLVVFISDFVYGVNSERLLKLAAKKFDLILMMVRDPRDMTLPKGSGEVLFEDPFSGETLLVTPNEIWKEFSQVVSGDIHHLSKILKKYGSDFLFLDTEKPFIKEIIKFFKIRASRWR